MAGAQWDGSPACCLYLCLFEYICFSYLCISREGLVGSQWDGSLGRKVIVRRTCNQLSLLENEDDNFPDMVVSPFPPIWDHQTYETMSNEHVMNDYRPATSSLSWRMRMSIFNCQNVGHKSLGSLIAFWVKQSYIVRYRAVSATGWTAKKSVKS